MSPIHSLAQATYTELDDDTTIIIDGQIVQFEHALYIDQGRIFVPVREIVEWYSGDIEWDGELRQVLLTTSLDDELVFTIDEREMLFNGVAYAMDVAPFLIGSRTYIPLRHAAEFLHVDVSWDDSTSTADLTMIPLYEVLEEDDLSILSELFETTSELLAERNELDEDVELEPGELIKVVIPTIMAEKLPLPDETAADEEDDAEVKEPHPELELMAKIIMVEAGWEPYEGMLAVGSVIMNRIASDRFGGSTVYDIVYAPNQFPPAHNGLLDKAEPNESAWKAAEAVLAGENNAEGALYFNHKSYIKPGSFWDRLTFVMEIGNQRFYK